MRQRTTTIGLGLFVAWACHDLEELFTMRETSRLLLGRKRRAAHEAYHRA